MAPIRVGALESLVKISTVRPFYEVNHLERNFEQASEKVVVTGVPLFSAENADASAVSTLPNQVKQHLVTTSERYSLIGLRSSIISPQTLFKQFPVFDIPYLNTSNQSDTLITQESLYFTNENTSNISENNFLYSASPQLPTASASILSGPRAAIIAEKTWLSEQTLLTMIGALLFGLILATIFGNLFVIWAVCVERTLRTVGNYLVFSLAITDLLVACLVMPFGAHYVIAQEWRLGVYMCELWSFLDVLCCTASIFHLLAIACDRYWAVTSVDYIHRRKAIHVCTTIAAIWILAGVVSLGPFFGWKDVDFEWRIVEKKQCLVSQSVTYQIFATFVSFYGPSGIILVLYFRIYQVAKKRIQLKKQRYRCRIRRRPSYYRPRKSMCEIGKEMPSIATSATHRPSFNPSSVDEFQTTSSSGFYSSVTGTSSTQETTLSLDLKPITHLQHPLQNPVSSPSKSNHLSPLSLVLHTSEHRSSFDSMPSNGHVCSGTAVGNAIGLNGNDGNSPPINSGSNSTGKRLSLEQFFLIQQQQQSIMCEQFVQACNNHLTAATIETGLHAQMGGTEKRHSATSFMNPSEQCHSNCCERKARKNSLFFRKRRESQTTPSNNSAVGNITTLENEISPSRSASPNLIVYVDDYTSTACSSCFYDDDDDDDDDEDDDDDDDDDDQVDDDDDDDRRKFERRKSRLDFMTCIPDIEEEAETNLEGEVVVINDEINGADYEIELIIDEDDLVNTIGHVSKSASTNNLPVLSTVIATTSNRKCSNSAPEIVIIPDREDNSTLEHDTGNDYEMKEYKPDTSEIGPEMAAGIAAARRTSRCMEGPCVIEIIQNTNAGKRKRSIVLRSPTLTTNGEGDNIKATNNTASSRRSSSGTQISPNSSLPIALVQLASESAVRTTTKAIKKSRRKPRVRIRKLRFGKGDGCSKIQTTSSFYNRNGATIRRTHRRHCDTRHESKAAKTLTIITGIFIICWAPFFILALVMPLCKNCVIDKFLFDFCSGLGWTNSSVNPLLYTIFSPDFRMAFKKLIFGSKRHKKKTRKRLL